MIQHVKEFGPELNIKRFGDRRDTGVLEDRQVHRREPGTVKAVAAAVAEHVGTVLHSGRCGGGECIRNATEESLGCGEQRAGDELAGKGFCRSLEWAGIHESRTGTRPSSLQSKICCAVATSSVPSLKPNRTGRSS